MMDSTEEEVQEKVYAAIRAMMAEILDQVREQTHQHNWQVAGVNMPTKPSVPFAAVQTNVLLICDECGWPYAASLVGSWEESQVRSIINGRNKNTD